MSKRRPIRGTVTLALAVFAVGCGAGTYIRSPIVSPPPVLTPWPRAADYTTLKAAVAVRDQALFRVRDWRQKSYAASLGIRVLLTLRLAPGRCADYVTELFGNLRDLMAAYPGEDWRPLVRFVRHEPSLASACRPPGHQLTV